MKHILNWNKTGNKTDLASWSRNKLHISRFTPDIQNLDQCVMNLVFLYANEMTGHTFHSLLQGPKDALVCPAFTSRYFMFPKKRLGQNTYPIMIETDKDWQTQPRYAVRGQLWMLPTSTVRVLDNYYSQSKDGAYERKRIHIRCPYRRNAYYPRTNAHVELGKGQQPDMVWSYVGREAVWLEKLNGLDYGKVKIHQPNGIHRIPPHYWFTTEEYE